MEVVGEPMAYLNLLVSMIEAVTRVSLRLEMK